MKALQEARGRLEAFVEPLLPLLGRSERRRWDTAPHISDPRSYQQLLEDLKLEVAAELGLGPAVAARGWADLPSRVNGAIGGRLGGQIGGGMVRRMISMAERDLAAHPRTGL